MSKNISHYSIFCFLLLLVTISEGTYYYAPCRTSGNIDFLTLKIADQVNILSSRYPYYYLPNMSCKFHLVCPPVGAAPPNTFSMTCRKFELVNACATDKLSVTPLDATKTNYCATFQPPNPLLINKDDIEIVWTSGPSNQNKRGVDCTVVCVAPS